MTRAMFDAARALEKSDETTVHGSGSGSGDRVMRRRRFENRWVGDSGSLGGGLEMLSIFPCFCPNPY
jgi:hypothetical protein